MPRFPFILPRSCGCRLLLLSNSKPSPKSPKSQETDLKSLMSPLAINQIHFILQSIPPVPRGISVHPATVNSLLHRRQPLRRFATRRPLTEAERSPAAVGRRSATAVATAVAAVACLSGFSAKASTSGEEFVKKAVSSGNIVVFSKSYCPKVRRGCTKVKGLRNIMMQSATLCIGIMNDFKKFSYRNLWTVNLDVARVYIDFGPFTTIIPESSNMRDWYCAMVKSIFKEMNKDFSVIELDEREDGQDIQDALAKLVGRRTVPQVFIKGEHIGGCDDTMEAYESGRLAKLLTEIP